MDSLIFIIGFIVLCFIVIIVAGFFEAKIKKKNEPAPKNHEPAASETPEFIEGRIYQMEDGSFAKYAGNGKFLKVKK